MALPSANKADARSIPSGANAANYLTASELNELITAASHVINVRNHGLVEGDSAENAATNQAALAPLLATWEAAGRGAVLYWPANSSGIYAFNDEVVINARDRVMVGSGFRTTLKQRTAGKRVLVVEGNAANVNDASGNLFFHNLFFQNDGITEACVQVGGRTGTIYGSDGNDQPVTSIHFRNCWFQGGSYGLYLFDCYDSTILGNEAEGNATYSIRVESGGRIVIASNVFYDVGSAVSIAKHASLSRPHGIIVADNSLMIAMRGLVNVSSGEKIAITGNVGRNMGKHTSLQADQSGVYVGSADVDGLTIVGNSFTGHATIGQKLQYGVDVFGGAAGPTNVAIMGNDFSSTNIVVGAIREGCTAIRIGNLGDSEIRQRNSTGRVTYHNGVDLYANSKPFLPRLEQDAAPTVSVSAELWAYSGRSTQATLPAAELCYYHPDHGLGRVLCRTRIETEGTSAPGGGTWAVGDMCWNTTPTAGGTIGWVCTTAGTPGTWKTFGAIAA